MEPEEQEPVDQPIDEVQDQQEYGPTNLPEAEPIRWQAPEYIQEPRSPWWYIVFWVITAVIMAIAALLVKSVTFAVLVPVMAVALTMYSHRPPRAVSYVLSAKGLFINDQLHPFGEFRSFGVLQIDALPQLSLIPVRRFRPGVAVYFPAEMGEDIVDFMGARIPMQDVRLDTIDKLVRKLHI